MLIISNSLENSLILVLEDTAFIYKRRQIILAKCLLPDLSVVALCVLACSAL